MQVKLFERGYKLVMNVAAVYTINRECIVKKFGFVIVYLLEVYATIP